MTAIAFHDRRIKGTGLLRSNGVRVDSPTLFPARRVSDAETKALEPLLTVLPYQNVSG